MLSIIKGSKDYLNDYVEIFGNSDLDSVYFTDKTILRDFFLQGLEADEIHAAFEGTQCIGVMRIDTHGAFGGFSFLRLIGIKEDCRSKGYGKQLLEYFEKVASEKNNLAFLMVADFNTRARKLYETWGYSKVGEIPNIYQEGVTENLMMKKVEQTT